MLTIAYCTARKDPKIEWFLTSLKNQGGVSGDVSIVVVSFHDISKSLENALGVAADIPIEKGKSTDSFIRCVKPKPTVWQGEHRLTKQDWFSASNSRNTALCYAKDGYIAYADDLSVLMPGWLDRVRAAEQGGYVVCGSYRKVKDLVVDGGLVKSFSPHDLGVDNRLTHVSKPLTSCAGNFLYGCSVAGPVEAFLNVNGWPEICDGMGAEDYCMGIVLKNAGYSLYYDTQMVTYESEEHHHLDPAMRREDFHFKNGVPVLGGNGKEDKSHAMLNIALQSKRWEYDVGGGFQSIRELRKHILSGGDFPVRQNPQHCWYSKLKLSDL